MVRTPARNRFAHSDPFLSIAAQPIGMTITLNVAIQVTSLAGDTLTVRMKVNGTTLIIWTFVIPNGSSNLVCSIRNDMVVAGSTLRTTNLSYVAGTPTLVYDAPSYTRAQSNVFSITGQWGANASTATVKLLSMTAAFPNGA